MSEIKKKAKKDKKATKRIEVAMDNPEPVAALTMDEFTFAKELASGATAVAALAAAKPEWNKDTIASNAYLWKRNPVIIRAMQAIQEVVTREVAGERQSALIMTKTEAMIALSQGARSVLDEITPASPFCAEHIVTWNANGRSERVKKVSMIDCIKLLSELAGWKEVEKGGGGPGTYIFNQQNFLNNIVVQGLPVESSDIGEKLLEEDGAEPRPA